MNKIADLIHRIYLNPVPYKHIGELCDISRGVVMSKDFIRENEGPYPVYSSQTENNGELGKIRTFMFDGEYLTWTTDGANAGSVFYRTGKFSVTNVCGLLKVTDKLMSTKFLYYVLQITTKRFVNKGMGNPKLMSHVMSTIPVPVPPMEVQDEIVRILDNFTELIAELTAELTARRKQYEYYRKFLLNPSNFDYFQKVKIKDMFRRLRGTPITAGKMKEIADVEGNIDIYAGGETRVKAFESEIPNANIVRVPAVLVQSRGLIDFVYSNKPFTFKNEMWAYTHKNNFTVKYLYYIFKSEIDHFRKVSGGMGAMPQISLPVTEDYLVFLPSNEEQKRIVKKLDNFELLCNSMDNGLPAEIEARQKQYEYYRDKLLSFKELQS